jgi:hypothetical protein
LDHRSGADARTRTYDESELEHGLRMGASCARAGYVVNHCCSTSRVVQCRGRARIHDNRPATCPTYHVIATDTVGASDDSSEVVERGGIGREAMEYPFRLDCQGLCSHCGWCSADLIDRCRIEDNKDVVPTIPLELRSVALYDKVRCRGPPRGRGSPHVQRCGGERPLSLVARHVLCLSSNQCTRAMKTDHTGAGTIWHPHQVFYYQRRRYSWWLFLLDL